jgi:hypothetical protein
LIEFVSNLLGEIVEYHARGSEYHRKGVVRAVGCVAERISFVVEVVDDYDRDGELESLDISYHSIRPVKRCARCWAWESPSKMMREGTFEDPIGGLQRADLSGWAHRPGQGCRKDDSP